MGWSILANNVQSPPNIKHQPSRKLENNIHVSTSINWKHPTLSNPIKEKNTTISDMTTNKMIPKAILSNFFICHSCFCIHCIKSPNHLPLELQGMLVLGNSLFTLLYRTCLAARASPVPSGDCPCPRISSMTRPPCLLSARDVRVNPKQTQTSVGVDAYLHFLTIIDCIKYGNLLLISYRFMPNL